MSKRYYLVNEYWHPHDHLLMPLADLFAKPTGSNDDFDKHPLHLLMAIMGARALAPLTTFVYPASHARRASTFSSRGNAASMDPFRSGHSQEGHDMTITTASNRSS
ncbi:hypothetical protein FDECE_10731 [Fusarium decemcellulare]|nr:hypothetical protein FDECE_10731 [Fusarium decemcellulare]